MVYKCPICYKEYQSASYVEQHVNLHTGEKPYKCKLCPKQFALASYLNIHSFTHESTSFKCVQCSKLFKSEEIFIRHQLVHQREKLNQVKDCLSKKPVVLLSRLKSVENHQVERLAKSCKEKIPDSNQVPRNDENAQVPDEYQVERMEKLNALKSAVLEQFRKLSNMCSKPFHIFPLDLPKELSDDKRFPSIWTFTCHQMPDNVDIGKKKWELRYVDIFDSLKKPLIPPFIMRIVMVLGECFQNLLISDCNDKDMKIVLLTNAQQEVMAVLSAQENDKLLRNTFENFLATKSDHTWHLKSFFFISGKCVPELLFGAKAIEETIGNLKVEISARRALSLNASSVEILMEAINEYLGLYSNATLLEIGCSIGLLSSLLASKCQNVIGLDQCNDLKIAKAICEYNKLKNVKFVEDNIRDIELMFEELEKFENIIAIIEHDSRCALSPFLMQCCRNLENMKQIIVVTPFKDYCFPPLLTLMDCNKESYFKPTRSRVIEQIDSYHYFNCVILLERTSLN